MSVSPELIPTPAPAPDACLLELIDAALQLFGPSIRLRYHTDRLECVLAFPDKQPESIPLKQESQT